MCDFIDSKYENVVRYSKLGFRLQNSRQKRKIFKLEINIPDFISLLYILSSPTTKILFIDVIIQRKIAV